MDAQRAAEIQAALVGVALPASKDEVIAYARTHEPGAAADLAGIADREYGSIDEVGEELVRVQPSLPERAAKTPRPESGEPPGGADYTTPYPEPGAVRDDAPADNPPQKTIERQSELLKEQQAKQDA